MITIQCHKYEGIPKQGHNSDPSVRLKERHIRGKDEGGFIKTIIDCDWKDTVDNILFKDAIQKFNDKQTRKDRKKESYYEECKEREQKDEERKILKKSTGDTKNIQVFRPVHELVIGFYGKDISQQEKIKLLEKYIKFFQQEYVSNLHIVGAYIHVDEQTDLIKQGVITPKEICTTHDYLKALFNHELEIIKGDTES